MANGSAEPRSPQKKYISIFQLSDMFRFCILPLPLMLNYHQSVIQWLSWCLKFLVFFLIFLNVIPFITSRGRCFSIIEKSSTGSGFLPTFNEEVLNLVCTLSLVTKTCLKVSKQTNDQIDCLLFTITNENITLVVFLVTYENSILNSASRFTADVKLRATDFVTNTYISIANRRPLWNIKCCKLF